MRTKKSGNTQFQPADFHRSSACGWAGSCVGVAVRGGIIAVTNTNDTRRRTVRFNKQEWSDFLAGVKNGEFEVK